VLQILQGFPHAHRGVAKLCDSGVALAAQRAAYRSCPVAVVYADSGAVFADVALAVFLLLDQFCFL
jgi:hypothetical protein